MVVSSLLVILNKQLESRASLARDRPESRAATSANPIRKLFLPNLPKRFLTSEFPQLTAMLGHRLLI